MKLTICVRDPEVAEAVTGAMQALDWKGKLGRLPRSDMERRPEALLE